MSARELRRELAAVEQAIWAHRDLTAPVVEESLLAVAGEQYTILAGDRRSFASARRAVSRASGGRLLHWLGPRSPSDTNRRFAIFRRF